MDSRYLALEIPDDHLIRAIAEEAALTDRDLDSIERRLIEASPSDPGLAAALALTLGRAGRARSAGPIEIAQRRLTAAGAMAEAQALALGLDLLALRPPARVERAESGYRHQDVIARVELYVGDPLAAHWHQRDRWGPPIRPDVDHAARWAAPGTLDGLAAFALEGGVVVVGFAQGRWSRGRELPLRLCCAGLSRDPGMRTITRWSQVDSVGMVTRRVGLTQQRAVAFEVSGEPVEILPTPVSLPADELLDLMARLLNRARS